MWRICLGLVVFGCMVFFWGVQEFRVSSGASTEPVLTDLAAIENGEDPPDTFVKFESVFVAYHEIISEYMAYEGDHSEPGPETEVNVSYYPVVSKAKLPQFQKKLIALKAKYNGTIPDNVELPSIGEYSLLVKTKRFETWGELPWKPIIESNVQGLIVNEIESLGEEEKQYLKQGFPNLDFSKVLILEDQRQPSSAFKSFGMMGGGLLLVLGGVGLFFVIATSD